MWKCRCIHVHEGRVVGIEEVIKWICREITDRATADFRRLPRAKFLKTWVTGASFVSVVNEDLHFSLPKAQPLASLNG